MARASLKNQVLNTLKEIQKFGVSKKGVRDQKGKLEIYSIRTFKDTLNTSINFAEFAKERFGVRKIHQLTEQHKDAYLQDLKKKGRTVGHLVNVENRLLKFQMALERVAEKLGKEPVRIIQGRTFSPNHREKPINRSYSRLEIEKLEKHMSPKVREGMYMSLNLGLRNREVATLRVEHVVRENGVPVAIKIERGDGKGITKGGRYRDIPVQQRYQEHLESLLRGKSEGDKVLGGIKANSLRHGLSRASEKAGVPLRGWHGFRHTYARDRLTELLGERLVEGKEMIQHILSNREKHIRVDRGITPDTKKLYEFVRQQINTIHHELGHGDNRWGLVAVYMSF